VNRIGHEANGWRAGNATGFDGNPAAADIHQHLGETRIRRGAQDGASAVAGPNQGARNAFALLGAHAGCRLVHHDQRRWPHQGTGQCDQTLLTGGQGFGQTAFPGRIPHHGQRLARVGYRSARDTPGAPGCREAIEEWPMRNTKAAAQMIAAKPKA